MNIYFAGSIRGGREDIKKYQTIIKYLQTQGTVLTEHIGLEDIHSMGEADKTDAYIYNRDIAWLNEADIIVAEVTHPSLGVGYELAYAEGQGVPVLCLFRTDAGNHLSAMIEGNPYFKVIEYTDINEVLKELPVAMALLTKMV